jgi:hypothetical protein
MGTLTRGEVENLASMLQEHIDSPVDDVVTATVWQERNLKIEAALQIASTSPGEKWKRLVMTMNDASNVEVVGGMALAQIKANWIQRRREVIGTALVCLTPRTFKDVWYAGLSDQELQFAAMLVDLCCEWGIAPTPTIDRLLSRAYMADRIDDSPRRGHKHAEILRWLRTSASVEAVKQFKTQRGKLRGSVAEQIVAGVLNISEESVEQDRKKAKTFLKSFRLDITATPGHMILVNVPLCALCEALGSN